MWHQFLIVSLPPCPPLLPCAEAAVAPAVDSNLKNAFFFSISSNKKLLSALLVNYDYVLCYCPLSFPALSPLCFFFLKSDGFTFANFNSVMPFLNDALPLLYLSI
jgi:hypothetical protein